MQHQCNWCARSASSGEHQRQGAGAGAEQNAAEQNGAGGRQMHAKCVSPEGYMGVRVQSMRCYHGAASCCMACWQQAASVIAGACCMSSCAAARPPPALAAAPRPQQAARRRRPQGLARPPPPLPCAPCRGSPEGKVCSSACAQPGLLAKRVPVGYSSSKQAPLTQRGAPPRAAPCQPPPPPRTRLCTPMARMLASTSADTARRFSSTSSAPEKASGKR